MSNWVDNRVIVNGPRGQVNELVKLMQGDGPFDFNNLIPCSTHSVDTHRENWGTKWNACAAKGDTEPLGFLEELSKVGQVETEQQAEWSFQTAWGPPEVVIVELSRRFPALSVEWSCIEEQPSFGGFMVLVAGEVVEGGFLEGDEDGILGMSPWHEQYRYDEDEDEEAET